MKRQDCLIMNIYQQQISRITHCPHWWFLIIVSLISWWFQWIARKFGCFSVTNGAFNIVAMLNTCILFPCVYCIYYLCNNSGRKYYFSRWFENKIDSRRTAIGGFFPALLSLVKISIGPAFSCAAEVGMAIILSSNKAINWESFSWFISLMRILTQIVTTSHHISKLFKKSSQWETQWFLNLLVIYEGQCIVSIHAWCRS